ncbi:hypothetical protein U1Q18_028950 [Sarracenia purpurea var. burkii]
MFSFLAFQSYASILYLRIPPGFRIILRGKDIDHHNLINDMMLTQEIIYKPQLIADGLPKDQNTFAVVTLGFVKDARYHIDIQGFNVYHKNRLIKPFWRVWNAAGSDGRGVLGILSAVAMGNPGVLEANFVEPAHDKQGFERTTTLARLEARLVVMQKKYWSSNCHEIGYAQRRHSKKSVSPERESTPDKEKSSSRSNSNGHFYSDGGSNLKSTKRNEKRFPAADYASEVDAKSVNRERPARSHHKVADMIGDGHASASSYAESMFKLKEENHELSERLKRLDGLVCDLQFQRDKCRSLEIKLQDAQQKIAEMDKEQESLVDIFSEERNRRDAEEDSLRRRLQDASTTIQELVEKVKLLESRRVLSCKIER